MIKRQAQMLSTVIAAILVITLSVPGWTGEAAAETYRLKIQSGYPRGDLSMETLKVFADSAKKRSNGQVLITVFAAPEIVEGGGPAVYEAVQRGTLDMAMQAGIFASGFAPIGDVEFGLPFAFEVEKGSTFKDSAEKIRDFYYKSGLVDLLRQEYAKHGLYWLDMHSYGYRWGTAGRNPRWSTRIRQRSSTETCCRCDRTRPCRTHPFVPRPWGSREDCWELEPSCSSWSRNACPDATRRSAAPGACQGC